ncbi:MAG: PAS domain S-box protein [Candidatus Helarchaeota archaeon]
MESEEKFRTIAEQSYLGIAIIQDLRVKYANEAIVKITGYSIEEALNWAPYDFLMHFHPDDRPILKEQILQILSSNARIVKYHPYRIITKSGDMKWIELYSRKIKLQEKDALLITGDTWSHHHSRWSC